MFYISPFHILPQQFIEEFDVTSGDNDDRHLHRRTVNDLNEDTNNLKKTKVTNKDPLPSKKQNPKKFRPSTNNTTSSSINSNGGATHSATVEPSATPSAELKAIPNTETPAAKTEYIVR